MADDACVNITWVIKNFLYLHVGDPFVDSAEFSTDFLHKSVWKLRVYPLGTSDDGGMSVQLICNNHEAETESKIWYEISFLSNDSKVFNRTHVSVLPIKSNVYEMPGCPKCYDVCFEKRDEYLPDNNLTIQCRIGELCGNNSNNKTFKACTDVFVNNHVFCWPLPGSQTLLKETRIEYLEDCELSFKVEIFSTMDSNHRELYCINLILNSDVEYVFITSHLTAFGKSGIMKKWYGEKEYFSKGESFSFTDFVKEDVMGKQTRGVDTDFQFVFDLKFSTGGYRSYIESTFTIPPKIQKAIYSSQIINSSEFLATPYNISSNELQDDFLALLQDQTLSDFTLQAENKTFPVHKAVLAARSPVFKAMFSTDMVEASAENLDITDVDAKTLVHLLTFIYTAVFPDSKCNMAKLYYAADKYQMMSLKEQCSKYLKENLTSENICEVLTLADRHQDEELKHVIEDFLVEKDRKFIQSSEWIQFIKDNPLLAAETMQTVCLKVMNSVIPSE